MTSHIQPKASWEERFEEKFGKGSEFCGCFEGDLREWWPEGKEKLKAFIDQEVQSAYKAGQKSRQSEIDHLTGEAYQ